MQAGYTKEINLISSTLDKKERTLQAMLFQWYRHQIALKYNIVNFKPVILFRSKTIDESKADYEEFLRQVDTIAGSDFRFLNTISKRIDDDKGIHEQGKSRTLQVLQYIKKEKIQYPQIANWIKQNFTTKNIIITNSQNNKTKTEKTDEQTENLLNNLEDKNNSIRAIFTVQRLTEGWDVLNLFDIVRLYEGRDESRDKAGNVKAGTSTISEKQLIGRGVRYFPFTYNNEKIKNKRKFDNDLKHELRVLEELYFYSTSDHRYIDELKRELKKDGYIRDDRIIKTFGLKLEFKNSDFYQNTKIWYNEQVNNPYRRKKTLDDIRKDFFVPYKIKGLNLREQKVDFEKQEDLQKLILEEDEFEFITIEFKDIEKHIFLKSVNKKTKQDSLYQFENLKKELDIKSIEELRTDKLADFKVKIIVNKNTKYEDIDNNDKLGLVMKFLESIFAELKNNITPKIGSEFKAGNFEKFFSAPKTKSIQKDIESERIAEELKNKEWYVLDDFVGTSEEEGLIEFIKETIGNLKI